MRPEFYRRAAVLPLVVVVVLHFLVIAGVSLWLLHRNGVSAGPSGYGMGSDFAMFWAGAHVFQHGGNPYDPNTLYLAERSLLTNQHLTSFEPRSLIRVGNPPVFLWALQPLNRLPFQVAAIFWMAGLYVLFAFGFLAMLRYLGWRRKYLPLLAFLLVPQVVLSTFYGNVQAILLAATGVSLVLVRRRPVPAGVVLALVWIKPQLGLPIALLIVVFHSEQSVRIAAGFAGGTLGLLALTGTGPVREWLGALGMYSRDIALQPNLSSLTGLYATWAPSGWRTVLTAAAIFLALALTAIAWRRSPRPIPAIGTSLAWLWFVWFLASPYAHFPDEVMLALPVLLLMGRDAVRLATPIPLVVLYLLIPSFLVFPSMSNGINLLCLPVAVSAVLAYRAHGQRTAATAPVDRPASVPAGV